MTVPAFEDEYLKQSKRFVGFVEYNLGNEHPKFIHYTFKQIVAFLNLDNPYREHEWMDIKTNISYFQEVLQSLWEMMYLLGDTKYDESLSFLKTAISKLESLGEIIP